MNIQFTNFATGSLNAGISNSATSLTLNTGQGALFPTLVGSQYFYAVITDAATKTTKEIIKVTARTADTFTIVRGQDGTTGLTWLASDVVELRLTAAGIGDVASSAGISIVNATITTSTTISGTHLYVPVAMTTLGQSVTLPAATTLSIGGPQYIIDNTKGGYPAGIRDSSGALLMAVAAGGEAFISLKDNSTAGGVWSVTGTGLEPGLITVDSTFSSTYAGTILTPFIVLDNNTSIHFAALASGFAAFVVDNTGKVLTTPVTVDATASSVPVQCWKVSATTAIVFYGAGTTSHKAVVLTLTGSSPSFSLSVGAPATLTATMSASWDGEDFKSAPKIAQLSSTLYLASYKESTNTSTFAVAISVSGSTVTIGTIATIISSASLATSTTTYALTSTTALVLYQSGGPPAANNAVVVSVSGTTCTVGTPVTLTGCSNSTQSAPPSSCVLSPTKAIVVADNNSTTVVAIPVTISGTTATAGTAFTVESGITLTTNGATFTGDSATRYNPHLWAIGSNTAGLWYFQNGGYSRAVVLSESGGTITAGTIAYRSISSAVTNAAGFGVIVNQGTTEFLAIRESVANTAGFGIQAQPSKISGSTITQGAGISLRDVFPASPSLLVFAKSSNGDYLILSGGSQGISGQPRVPVLRSNGDCINNRGSFSVPEMSFSNGNTPVSNVAPNRFVIIGAAAAGTTIAVGTYQLRLLNVEIAA